MDERETRRDGYPLTIPDALLRSEALERACAERNFQEIFRLVNRRTGSSHAVMAAAIGKMTSSRVSDIIRGVRGIRGHKVIERVADGFGIPGEMLGLPKRPWEGEPKSNDASGTGRGGVDGAQGYGRDAIPGTHTQVHLTAVRTGLDLPQADGQQADRSTMDSFRVGDHQLGAAHLSGTVPHNLRNCRKWRRGGHGGGSTTLSQRGSGGGNRCGDTARHRGGTARYQRCVVRLRRRGSGLP